ncbi:MAG TPA: hypothetical protein VH062_31855 [Polyangiaceae bacterium]|jgi:hypothetical protein|nr:hypothetical protein [Polyangiaceae bacterium]
MSRAVPVGDLAVVALVKAALSVAVLAGGFVALSDDDFSRIVIGEQFAHAPSLDPSGTSWLPLPFWLLGTAMAVFGRTLATAHATAVLSGVLSALLVHRAARWLRVSRAGSVLAAIVASSILTAAKLGASVQPEALTAGLVTLGAASTRVDGSRRTWGAVALFAACLCRYETWAAAAMFALLTSYDAFHVGRPRRPREVLTSGFAPLDTERRYGESEPPGPLELKEAAAADATVAGVRRKRLGLLAVAALPLLAPLAWIVHGVISHHDALFFLHRVAAYRRALGVTEPVGRSLLAYPALLFRVEPEVTLSAILVLRIAADRAPRALSRLVRPALVVLAMLVFLVVGRALDGAPTHHAARTLLPLWTLCALLVSEAIVRTLSPVRGEFRSDAVGRLAPFAVAVALVSVLLRTGRVPESDASRTAECAIGLAARERVGPDERVLVDTADYGYFAVIAAFGAPERATPVERHDPRDPHVGAPFETADTAAALFAAAGATWGVLRVDHAAVISRSGTVEARSGDFSLVHLTLR